MAPAPGVHIPLRYLRALIKKGASTLRNRVLTDKTSYGSRILYEPAYARVGQRTHHPVHQRIKVAKRWYTTQFSQFLNSAAHGAGQTVARAGHETVSRHPTSKIGTAVGRLTSTSPFAHTLRPNLTGGALPRTASGYSLGSGGVNGARYFSHCNPAAPAQVIAQVTAGVRAFIINGKDEMDFLMKQKNMGIKGGILTNVNEKNKQRESTPPKGAFIDFNIAPTITCLSPVAKNINDSAVSLETPGFMEELSMDIAVTINDLSVTLSDIQKIKTELGDLPIALVNKPSKVGEICLRVYFPDREPEYVERLCQEIDIRRGVVRSVEDDDEDPIRARDKAWGEAFEFLMPTLVMQSRDPSPRPFWDGPTTAYNVDHGSGINWNDMLTPSHTPDTESLPSGYTDVDQHSDYEGSSDIFEGESLDVAHVAWSPNSNSTGNANEHLRDYDGLHGIYRFLEEIEEHRSTRNPWN